MQIPKFTFGVGDRFAHQGEAQLKAFIEARELGLDIHPVWNKSNREHNLTSTQPSDVRTEAQNAVRALGWSGSYFVDADHINLETVPRFLKPCDFFTLDVADQIGKPCEPADAAAFLKFVSHYNGVVSIPGIDTPFEITESFALETANKFLAAIKAAGKIYRYILENKGAPFVTEISVDETDRPQIPAEIFLILAMIAQEQIPVQTIAPKFTGRFNKGVDYVGDLAQFEKEFEDDICVIAFAIKEFSLPASLKLSVHSGSDKFSIYPIINKLVAKHGCGLHVKTAGTTWLEELIGLAEANEDGLELAKEIFQKAMAQYNELTRPYASVIDINQTLLPSGDEVNLWDSNHFVQALRHDPTCPIFNPNMRQLLHVAFKLAAKMGTRYHYALVANRAVIEKNVLENILQRHIIPIFGKPGA